LDELFVVRQPTLDDTTAQHTNNAVPQRRNQATNGLTA
jgi:hypothetical protein